MKVKPTCPACETVGNMAGTMEGVIFCATCGGHFSAQEIWDFMQKMKPKKSKEASK